MSSGSPEVIGRYALYDVIAQGGMASVHYGRALGAEGFSRVVAIKRLHQQLAKEPEFVAMLLDEARLTSRIRHPNVVSVTDLVKTDDEVLLVMDYVHGESLSGLVRLAAHLDEPIPLPVVMGIIVPALHGLHAAHTALGDDGEPLGLVHRDVSPQNILVSDTGTTHVVDFGISKAVGRLQTTREGHIKGKPGYMSPEQVLDSEVDVRTDVFAAGIVLWEMLTLRRLFSAKSDAATLMKVINGPIDWPGRLVKHVSRQLDAVVMRSLTRELDERYGDALSFAEALEEVCPPGSPATVAKWMRSLAADRLAERDERLAVVERTPPGQVPRAVASSGELAFAPTVTSPSPLELMAPTRRDGQLLPPESVTHPMERPADRPADGTTDPMPAEHPHHPVAPTVPLEQGMGVEEVPVVEEGPEVQSAEALEAPPQSLSAPASQRWIGALAAAVALVVAAVAWLLWPGEPLRATAGLSVPSIAEISVAESDKADDSSTPEPASAAASASASAVAQSAPMPVAPWPRPQRAAQPVPAAKPPEPRCKLVATRDARGVKVFRKQCR